MRVSDSDSPMRVSDSRLCVSRTLAGACLGLSLIGHLAGRALEGTSGLGGELHGSSEIAGGEMEGTIGPGDEPEGTGTNPAKMAVSLRWRIPIFGPQNGEKRNVPRWHEHSVKKCIRVIGRGILYRRVHAPINWTVESETEYTFSKVFTPSSRHSVVARGPRFGHRRACCSCPHRGRRRSRGQQHPVRTCKGSQC